MSKKHYTAGFERGFTIIEAAVYLGLFGLLMGGAIVAAYNSAQGISRGSRHAMLQEEGNFVMAKINWALAGAQSVSSPSTGSSGSLLSVNKTVGLDASGNPIVVPVSVGLTAGALYIDTGTGPQILTNPEVRVTRLSFVHLVASGNGLDPERVEASTTLTARTDSGLLVSEDFSAVTYLRR